MALIEIGVPVSELAEMPQLAKARRCKSMYNSDQVAEIRAFAQEVEQAFEGIRLEYAKQSVD